MVRAYMYTRDIDLEDREDIYVVWISKVLQNNKALLSTTYPDTRYYEITYNGDKNEFYFDAYVKEINQVIDGKELERELK
jgi:hypothetical protein